MSFGQGHDWAPVHKLRLIGKLVECGLRSLHTVIVKPFWSKSVGSMYLQNDFKARSRAAVIGCEMTAESITAAFASKGGRSGAHTSFAGRSSVAFRSFPVSVFHRFGLLSDDYTQVAQRIFSQMTGQSQPLCDETALYRLRLDR